MNPSWYDVLGVDQDTPAADIRAAWKASIADLDPTDRRFRQRNRAAEVLLDPARRAAHDAELAAAEDDEPDGAEESPEPEPAPAPLAPVGPVVSLDKQATLAGSPPPADPLADPPADPLADPPAAPVEGVMLLAAGLAVVALVLVVVTVVSLVRGDEPDDTAAASDPSVAASSPSESSGPSEPSEAAAQDDLPDAGQIEAARGAAEAAVVPVLSYDYRTLEASEEAAVTYLTPAYAEEYRKNFAAIVEPNAATTQTIVSVELVASGVVRTGVDRVDVLLFVNRPTRNVERDQVYRDQVTARMLAVDGAWLVDCLITQPGDVCGA